MFVDQRTQVQYQLSLLRICLLPLVEHCSPHVPDVLKRQKWMALLFVCINSWLISIGTEYWKDIFLGISFRTTQSPLNYLQLCLMPPAFNRTSKECTPECAAYSSFQNFLAHYKGTFSSFFQLW